MSPDENQAYEEALRRILEGKKWHTRNISLSGLGLRVLPPEIVQLSDLVTLDLEQNLLNALPREFTRLTALKHLDLSNNNLCDLPSGIGQLSALTDLFLTGNKLTHLPPEIGRLTELETFSISGNRLTSLPQEMGNLSALEDINLSDNHLTNLPTEIGQLSALETIDLSRNRLTCLPPQIGRLYALESINLADNRLVDLPVEFGQLLNLWEMDLSGNRLTILAPEISQLSRLKRLYLAGNRLRTLPPEIGLLKDLWELDLAGNKLETLPPEIGKLSGLKQLGLADNNLRILPPEIGHLSLLQNLDLSDNQLSRLPAEIGQLAFLTELDLTRNNLTSLPSELGKLTSLSRSFLHGNPELALPEEVLGPTWQLTVHGHTNPASPKAILDYYFARRQQGQSPMQEVRVLLVGRGRVGKTSLIKKLKGEPFDVDERETPGITVNKLPLNCEPGTATAHLWDFGGQEFLHGTHQIFLSERCVYVLVLEGRESNWEIETDYWIRFIQSFGGDSPIVVTLNKFDTHAFSVDEHRLKERCPQIAGFVPTDAFTGTGMEELRNLLARTVGGIRNVWLGVPLKWHAVKAGLEDMPQKFLEYGDYQDLCARHGVTDYGEQDSLAVTLHRLGVALNFRDHHRLRHTSVLKPQWVTEAIYGLIRYTQNQKSHGVLHEDWLSKALQPLADYPPSRHAFVLDLMAKFEVAFPLEESEAGKERNSRWLIPELLGESQPEAFEQFRGRGVRRLRFTYPDALPPGLLPRLIVRTHEMSEARPDWRWRSGVVLEWQGCQALVRLDRLQRQTEVAVIAGPLPEQQALFDIIRAHLVVLHGKVRVVEETEVENHPGTWVRVEKLRRKERERESQIEEETDNGDPVMVPVSKTLDEVESDAATTAAGPTPPRRLRLFISYAHDNEKELQPVRQHLTLLGQRGYIQVWHDRDLLAGEKWETGITDELNRADIVLLFYTTKARVSRFIQETELPIALERAGRGECTLIWVPLERNDLDESIPNEKLLKELQCATIDAMPIYNFDPREKGWLQVEDSIRSVVERRRKLTQTLHHHG